MRRKDIVRLAANNSSNRLSQLLSAASLRLDMRTSSLDSRITATRASTKTYFDSTGTMQTAAVNEFPREYDPSTLTCLGRSFWEARTNSIRNNTMQGAAAGTPGTLPTNWAVSGAITGLTREIVGTGTENGINYIDIKYSGTTGGALNFSLYFEGNSTQAASNGQVWDQSIFPKLVGGSTSNVGFRIVVRENTGGGVYVNETQTAYTPTSAALGQVRVDTTRTLGATAAFVNGGVAFVMSSGVAVDFTLRIGMPQLELGATATPVIATTSAAATRAADVASMTGTNFSSWYNQTEGTILFTGSKPGSVASGEFPTLFAISAGAAITNEHSMYFPQVATKIYNLGISGGANQYNLLLGSLSEGAAFTATTAYKANDIGGTLNGAAVTTDASATIPATMDRLTLGARGTVAQWLNGYISRIAYWPSRLPNTDLQILSRST